MRILHINSYYSVSSFYGSLYEKQIKSGLLINVYVPVPYDYERRFNYKDYVLLSRNHKNYDRYIFHIKHIKILNDIKKKFNIYDFDIIHAHSLFSNGYIAYRLNKRYGIPYIVAVRNTDLNTFFDKLFYLRKLGIKILRNASKIVFISDSYKNELITKYLKKDMIENFSDKSVVIPNGVDDYWINNIFNEKRFLSDTLKILQVGDIDKNKNVITSIKVVEHLNYEGIKSELIVVGKSVSKELLSMICKSKYAKYLGVLNKKQLLEQYRSSDIFLLPSKNETFGIVYVEAITQGLPIIYTRNQGFDKQFNDGEVGYPVTYNNVFEIVDTIKLIISRYYEFSNNIRNKISRFNWENIENDYRNIYNEVLERELDVNCKGF